MSWEGDEVTDPMCEEAANEIKRLRSEVGRLTAANSSLNADNALLWEHNHR